MTTKRKNKPTLTDPCKDAGITPKYLFEHSPVPRTTLYDWAARPDYLSMAINDVLYRREKGQIKTIITDVKALKVGE